MTATKARKTPKPGQKVEHAPSVALPAQPAHFPTLAELASRPDDYGAFYFALVSLVRPLASLAEAADCQKIAVEDARLFDLVSALQSVVPQVWGAIADATPMLPRETLYRAVDSIVTDLAAAAACIHVHLNTPTPLKPLSVPIHIAATDLVRRAWKTLSNEHAEEWAKAGQESPEPSKGRDPLDDPPAAAREYLRPTTNEGDEELLEKLRYAVADELPLVFSLVARVDHTDLTDAECRVIANRTKRMGKDVDALTSGPTTDGYLIIARVSEMLDAAEHIAAIGAEQAGLAPRIATTLYTLLNEAGKTAFNDEWNEMVGGF